MYCKKANLKDFGVPTIILGSRLVDIQIYEQNKYSKYCYEKQIRVIEDIAHFVL